MLQNTLQNTNELQEASRARTRSKLSTEDMHSRPTAAGQQRYASLNRAKWPTQKTYMIDVIHSSSYSSPSLLSATVHCTAALAASPSETGPVPTAGFPIPPTTVFPCFRVAPYLMPYMLTSSPTANGSHVLNA
ncbi:hypothetical protein PSPO01_13641 [Paraphaeosphaeria sporulosa]